MNFLALLAERLDRAVTAIGKTTTWLAFALVGVILFDVITRRFLVLGSTKLQELEWHIHTILFMFCVGYAYVAGAHVRIDLLRERMSERTRQWIELLGGLTFAIPYCGVLVYLSVGFAYNSFVDGEISSAGTGLSHRWIIKTCLGVGFVLLLLSAVCAVLRSVVTLFGPPALVARMREIDQARSGFAAEPLDDPSLSARRRNGGG